MQSFLYCGTRPRWWNLINISFHEKIWYFFYVFEIKKKKKSEFSTWDVCMIHASVSSVRITSHTAQFKQSQNKCHAIFVDQVSTSREQHVSCPYIQTLLSHTLIMHTTGKSMQLVYWTIDVQRCSYGKCSDMIRYWF